MRQVQPSFTESVTAYVAGWRFQASAVFGCFIAMYLGWLAIAGGLSSADRRADAALATMAAMALVMAIFLINDASDRDIDALVHPDRPIPRGVADWRHIYALAIALFIVALILAALTGFRFALAVAGLIALTIMYYSTFKRHTPWPCASELIAPLISAGFPVTAFAMVDDARLPLMLGAAGFVYLADMAQDLLGGIHDEEGDRRFNVHTFAVAVGPQTTRWISLAAFLLSIGAAVGLSVGAGLGWLFAAVLAVSTVAMLSQYWLVLRADGTALPEIAGRANHLGGVFYFVVSASLLPDYLLRVHLGMAGP